MTRLPVALLTSAILALSATPAFAGGKGGGDTTPPPAPTADPCEGHWGDAGVVNRTAGGCVVVAISPAGTLSLDHVVLVDGWSYVVESNGEGTNSRVQLAFANATTGQRASIRVELGKTVIR